MTIKEILNSDCDIYGGDTIPKEVETIKTQVAGAGTHPFFLDISLAPFSAKIFEVMEVEGHLEVSS